VEISPCQPPCGGIAALRRFQNDAQNVATNQVRNGGAAFTTNQYKTARRSLAALLVWFVPAYADRNRAQL
jgi:hypothetical protein